MRDGDKGPQYSETEIPRLEGYVKALRSADVDLIPELDTVVARARDLGRNNGIAASGYQGRRGNIVRHVLAVPV